MWKKVCGVSHLKSSHLFKVLYIEQRKIEEEEVLHTKKEEPRLHFNSSLFPS